MNLILLEQQQSEQEYWSICQPRQLQHLRQHLKIQVGDTLKVAIRNEKRYLARVVEIGEKEVVIAPIQEELSPQKLPLTLIVALPRPKVLRRLIMDSVTLGVEKMILLHSYRVDKSYWQSPFLQQIPDYVQLGLEQAGDPIEPQIETYSRFKPFVEDVLPQLVTKNPAFVAHPYATQTMPVAIETSCTLIIGPEGGFIPYEIDLLVKNGCQAVTLGNRILRTESAIPYAVGRLFSRF